MRTMLLTLASAVSALAATSPAAAQWAPQPYGYGSPGYGGYGYGYGNPYGRAASLQARVDGIRSQIARLSQAGMLNPWQAQRFFGEARELDSRIREEAYERDGHDLRKLEERVERLSRQVRQASYSRYGYRGYGNAYGYNGYYNGGDRDDQRWDDRGDDGD